jgi:hypothetical protein
LVGSLGCRHSAPEEADELYFPADGAVGLEIISVQSGGDGSRNWLATYTDESGTTKFHIELDPAANSGNKERSAGSGKGRFRAEAGSNPIPLLTGLKNALQAKRMPSKVQNSDVLPFDYVVLGDNQSRSHEDVFRDKPRGHWTAMKIFLGDGKDEGEVFLNINGIAHQAEFSIKDAAYGDAVLKEMAKVL